MKPKLLSLVLIALAAGLAAVPAAADVAVTSDRTATNVSAHNTQLVWSRFGKDGRARLVRRVGGGARDVRVPPKDGPFDPDTGTSRGGNQVIVYTRCAGLSGQGCDVWEYNDGTRREHKVRGAASAHCSEFAPSVWIGTVAFARSGPGNCPGLYVIWRGKPRKLDSRVPSQTDVRGSTVAFLYTPAGAQAQTSVWVRSVYAASARRVVSGLSAAHERYRVTNPVLDGRYVYWLQEDVNRHEFFAGRGVARRRSPLEFTGRTFPGKVTAMALAGGRLFYVNGPGVFEATDPPLGFATRG